MATGIEEKIQLFQEQFESLQSLIGHSEATADIIERSLDSINHELQTAKESAANLQFWDALTKVTEQIQDITQAGQRRELLKTIAESANQILGADVTTLYEGDNTMKTVYPKPGYAGKLYFPTALEGEVLQTNTVFRYFEENETIFVPNTDKRGDLSDKQPNVHEGQRFAVREKIKSTAIVPLKVRGEKVGLLFINYRQSQTFDIQQQQKIKLFGRQVANALHNIQLLRFSVQQSDNLQSLLKISRNTIQGNLNNHKTMFASLITDATELMQASGGVIVSWENDHNGEVIAEYSTTSNQTSTITDFTTLTDDSLKERILNGETFLLQNIANDVSLTKSFREYLQKQQIHSILTAPAIREGKVIASIAVYQTDESRIFTSQDQRLIDNLANQVAISTELANYLQGQTELKQLRKMQENTLTAIENPEKVFDLIVSQGLELIGATKGQLMLLENNQLVTYASTVLGEAKKRITYSLDNSITGYVAKHNEPVNITNLQNDPKFKSLYQAGLDEDIVSEMAVPLTYQNEVIGVLNAESEYEGAFSERDFDLWKILASQAVSSIQVSREIIKNQQLLKEQDAVADIQYSLLTISGNYPEIIKQTLQKSQELVGAEVGHILFKEGSNDELLVVESTDGEDIDERVSIHRSVSGIALKEKRIVRVNDTKKEKPYCDVYQPFSRQDMRSQLIAPLMVNDEAIGVINVESTKLNAFTRDDEQRFERLKRQLALILQIERDAQRRNAILNTYQSIIKSGFDLEQVQQSIIETGVQLLGAENGSLLILDAILFKNDVQTQQSNSTQALLEGKQFDETSTLTVTAAYHPDNTPTTRGRNYLLHRCVSGAAILEDRIINIPNLKTSEKYKGIYQPIGKDMLSEIVAPLKVEGRIIGAINFEHTKAGVFNYQDEQLLQELTSAVALAWSQANLNKRNQSLEVENLETRLGAEVLHRLNNPLGAIRQYVIDIETFDRKILADNPSLNDSFKEIKRNAERASELALELRKSGRRARIKPINVSLLLNNALEHCQNNKSERMLAITPRIIEPSKEIHVSATSRLQQVFIDLMSNAIEAMPEGGSLTCQIHLPIETDENNEKQVQIDITDTGTGIPENTVEHIFADWFTSKSGDEFDIAHGIGLWWVRKYINSLGGNIDVKSKLGEGTTFTVSLPYTLNEARKNKTNNY